MHGTHRVTRVEPDGSITVVANNFRGARLNQPNDVIVKPDGILYFTDRDKVLYHKIVSNQYPLDKVNEAFEEAEWNERQTQVSRAVLVP